MTLSLLRQQRFSGVDIESQELGYIVVAYNIEVELTGYIVCKH